MEFTRRKLIGAVTGVVAFATAGGGYQQQEEEEEGGDGEMTDQIGTPKHDHSGDGHGGGSISPVESRTAAETITVEVPTEYPTVAAAVDDLKEVRAPPGVQYEVLIESGHAFQDEVYLEKQDMRHVTVTSVDATVPIDETAIDNTAHGRLFVGIRNVVMPTIDCLFDGGGSTTVRGLLIGRNAQAYLTPGSGFERMERGMELSGPGWIGGEHGQTDIISRDMSSRGVSIINGAFYLNGIDISGCGDFGIRMGEHAHGSIRGANAAGSRIGIRSTRSNWITAYQADLSGGEQGISVAGGTHVELVQADVSGGSASSEIDISSGSIVQANGCTTSGGTPAVGDTNVAALNDVTAAGIIFG